MRKGMKTVLALVTVQMLWFFNVESSSAVLIGRIVVAGYGPELPVMQDLGRAFEKANPGTAINFEWDRAVKAAEMVKSGEAQVAVTDRPDPALKTTPIAWDGIAVIVNFTNPVREVTSSQIKDLFTGKIKKWSELDGPNQTVEVLPRAPQDNVQSGFEASLGIEGQFHSSKKPVRTDEKVLRTVSGRDTAVTFISLSAALKAQADGIPIRILTVDKVEAGQPTVKNGQYKLRRPVLLLTPPNSNALTQAFVDFTTSEEGRKIYESTFVPRGPGSSETTIPPARLADDKNLSNKKRS